jgi:hypothetical protein
MGPDDTFNPTNFVDYTVEVYDTFAAFPEQGEPGRFYVDASDNHTYLWSNNLYAVIPNSFLRSVDSMPRYHTRLSVPNMADTEFAPLNSDTPTIVPTNMFFQDTDGDVQAASFSDAMNTTTYAAQGFITNYVQDAIQTIRIGNLDLTDPESFYDFLKMWPLYNDNGQVIGLFYSRELRDQAKERLATEKTTSKPRVNRLQQFLKKPTSQNHV